MIWRAADIMSPLTVFSDDGYQMNVPHTKYRPWNYREIRQPSKPHWTASLASKTSYSSLRGKAWMTKVLLCAFPWPPDQSVIHFTLVPVFPSELPRRHRVWINP